VPSKLRGLWFTTLLKFRRSPLLTPRLLCIAGDFTKYDQHAVQQINRNIELLRYKSFGPDLLLVELVNATVATTSDGGSITPKLPKQPGPSKTVASSLADADPAVRDAFDTLKAFLLSLGDDVQVKELRQYFAFKRLKNFASVEVLTKKLRIFVKVSPQSVTLEKGFTRDVSDIGHWGTGDLEITIENASDVEKAKPLLIASYERS
jgi:predicted transport protein